MAFFCRIYSRKFGGFKDKHYFCVLSNDTIMRIASKVPRKQIHFEPVGFELLPEKILDKMLDIERIIQTGIPDIAPIYGGVRGRTISSHKQAYAWKTIVEAGLQQVIDLRKDYSADRYPELCRQYGIDYFHYPIDNDRETIAKMVELFPMFCEKIDQGDFYIACAMGLHRTDIALCTYWVFYAADKGIAPPPIRGYRLEDGHNTNKIMRVLNAFYQHKADTEGKDPMPIDVFKERKIVINELSKI